MAEFNKDLRSFQFRARPFNNRLQPSSECIFWNFVFDISNLPNQQQFFKVLQYHLRTYRFIFHSVRNSLSFTHIGQKSRTWVLEVKITTFRAQIPKVDHLGKRYFILGAALKIGEMLRLKIAHTRWKSGKWDEWVEGFDGGRHPNFLKFSVTTPLAPRKYLF